MGTRADFYVGRDENAEWIGSIAYDGYSVSDAIMAAKSEKEFRDAVAVFLSDRDDATQVSDGWPWPWEDSNTTDYAYGFADGSVKLSRFGRSWVDKENDEYVDEPSQRQRFPNMKNRQNVTLGPRSGVMFLGVK